MNFSKFILTALILGSFLLQKTTAQSSYCWSKSLIDSGGLRFQDITTSPLNGDIYMGGYFSNDISVHFPTGINNTPDMSTTYGATDGFVAKYDSDGNEIWAFKVGGSSNDEINGVTLDTFGNVYITGSFTGAADFTGVTTSQVLGATSNGGADVFLAKYDTDGNLIWVKTIGGTGDEKTHDIAINSTGVFITGAFENFILIPGFSPIVSNGLRDVFILGYNLNGTPRWIKKAGGITVPVSFNDEGLSITADDNDVYVTGIYQGEIQFPGTPLTTIQAYFPGVSTIFIVEYDELTGARTWEDIIGGDFPCRANGITIDDNSIYLVGSLEGTVLFPSTGIPLFLTAIGSGSEIFSCGIDRITKNTNWVNIENNNVANPAAANDIVVDPINSIAYITGHYQGETDFNGGLNSKIALGGQDVFIMARSAGSGDFIWLETGGIGGSDEQGMGISFDSEEAVYVNGWFEQGITFGSSSLANGPQDDGFITKLNCTLDCGAPPSISNAGKDQVLYGESSTSLDGNVPTVGNGHWVNISGNSIIINPNNPSTFVDRLSDGESVFEWVISKENCEDSKDEVVVTVKPLVVPNLFSPNNDSDNDLFIVPGLDMLNTEVVIFNRWGVKLYRSINYQNDWDGTDELGENLPEDTYFYVIKIVETNQEINGFITLKR